MTARTHDIFAFGTLLTLSAYYPPAALNIPTAFTALVTNIVGALIPDLDQAGNRLWDLLPAGDYLGKIFHNIFYKHRSITHSLIGVLLVYKLLQLVLPKIVNPGFINPQIVLSSIMIGYLSHLLADAFTEEGIPLFFPLKISVGFPPIASWRIVTDGWFENYIIQPVLFVYLLFFIYAHQIQLLAIIQLVSK